MEKLINNKLGSGIMNLENELENPALRDINNKLDGLEIPDIQLGNGAALFGAMLYAKDYISSFLTEEGREKRRVTRDAKKDLERMLLGFRKLQKYTKTFYNMKAVGITRISLSNDPSRPHEVIDFFPARESIEDYKARLNNVFFAAGGLYGRIASDGVEPEAVADKVAESLSIGYELLEELSTALLNNFEELSLADFVCQKVCQCC